MFDAERLLFFNKLDVWHDSFARHVGVSLVDGKLNQTWDLRDLIFVLSRSLHGLVLEIM